MQSLSALSLPWFKRSSGAAWTSLAHGDLKQAAQTLTPTSQDDETEQQGNSTPDPTIMPACGLPHLAKALPNPTLEMELSGSLDGALTQKAKGSPTIKINWFIL